MAGQPSACFIPGRGNTVTPAPLAVQGHGVVGSVRVQGASGAQLRGKLPCAAAAQAGVIQQLERLSCGGCCHCCWRIRGGRLLGCCPCIGGACRAPTCMSITAVVTPYAGIAVSALDSPQIANESLERSA